MTEPSRYYLVDLYRGSVERSFDTSERLVVYLRRRERRGLLQSEAAYAIFYGQELATAPFWEKLKSENDAGIAERR